MKFGRKKTSQQKAAATKRKNQKAKARVEKRVAKAQKINPVTGVSKQTRNESYSATKAQNARTTRAGLYAGSAASSVASTNEANMEQARMNAEAMKYAADRSVDVEKAKASTTSSVTKNINVTGLENGGMVRATNPTSEGKYTADDSEYSDEYYQRLERM